MSNEKIKQDCTSPQEDQLLQATSNPHKHPWETPQIVDLKINGTSGGPLSSTVESGPYHS
jgi:hypothetical protein